MSNDPKKPSQRQDLTRWEDEGGAPRSGHPSHEPPFAPERGAGTALYYFNIQTGNGLVDDPEGETYPDLQAARNAALAKVRDMIAEGNQKGEDRGNWRVEVMDRANNPVLTVAFSELLNPHAPD